MLIGPRRSGKGTIGRLLGLLLGRHNVCSPTLHELGTERFALEPMIGKPVGIISDAKLSGRVDAQVVVERLLSITGEDAQTVPRKYKSAWYGTLPTRFIIMANMLPKFDDASEAISGRIIVLRMTNSFFNREDLLLGKKLEAELSGILNWALDGFDRLQQRGYLQQPPSGDDLAEQLAALASPIKAFIPEWCLTGKDRHGHPYEVECDRLYRVWCNWCEKTGHKPGATNTFGRSLRTAYPLLRTARTGSDDRDRQYMGIGLRAQYQQQ
jgi:putative DNA primase/helicase